MHVRVVDGVVAGGASGAHRVAGSVKLALHGQQRRGHVGDGVRDEERRDASYVAVVQFLATLVERLQTAHARPHHHPDALFTHRRQRIRADRQPGVLQRLLASHHGELEHAVQPPRQFRSDVLAKVQIGRIHIRGDAGVPVAAVELVDRPHTALAPQQLVVEHIHVSPETRHQPHTGDHHPRAAGAIGPHPFIALVARRGLDGDPTAPRCCCSNPGRHDPISTPLCAPIAEPSLRSSR
eukprot:ctg_336.g190